MDRSVIDRIVSKTIETHGENGAAYIITRDGETICSGGGGFADVENRLPFTTDTICRAFSCSKVVTSTACMMLIERGLLDTGWELGWMIPEFSEAFYIENGERKPSPAIRIRDLLNMTSGIAYPGGSYEGAGDMNDLWGRLDKSINDGASMTTQEFAAQAGACALAFPAGREWQYGSSADILGAVIERASGEKLSDFMRKNIFEPLGMSDTAFYVPPEKRGRLAVLYENAAEHPRLPSYVNLCIYDCDSEPAFQSGGAGLFTTASDLSKLGAMLSTGGMGLLSPKAIDFMRQNGLTPEQRVTFNWDAVRGCGYGNLVRSLEDRNTAGLFASPGSFGWDGWTGTYLLCDPEERLSVTVFTQRCGAGTTQLARSIVNAAYSL